MNLCPVLKETGRSVTTSDEPSYLFPDDSVDVITAFVQFVYEGFFVVTSSVTVEQVLDFMSRIGLVLTEESFQVFIVNILSCCIILLHLVIQITQFKTPDTVTIESPLDVQDDAGVFDPLSNKEKNCEEEEEKGNVEMSNKDENVAPVVSKDMEHLNKSKLPIYDENCNPRRSLRVKSTDPSGPSVSASIAMGRGSGVRTRNLLKVIPDASRSRRQSAPVEMILDGHRDKKKNRIKLKTCRFCNFTCQLVKDLIVHSDSEHPDEVFSCSECSYQGSCLAKLKKHQANTKHYPKKELKDTPKTKAKPQKDILLPKQDKEKPKEPVIKRAKRRLTFDTSNYSERKKEQGWSHQVVSAAEVDGNVNDIIMDNIEEELRLLGEGEDEMDISAPPEPVKSEPMNSSSLRLACSASNCNMSVPIINDSPDGAQEVVYQHQRTVHGYDDNQLCAQIVDNETDTSYKYVSSSHTLRVNQTTSHLPLIPNIGFWERKLMSEVRSKLGEDEFESTPVLKFDVKKSNGSQVNMLCKLSDKVIAEGFGDSDCAAREDAAFKAYYVSIKNVSCIRDLI